jgi:hypothetical protein
VNRKRLLLTDDELELLASWGELAKSVSAAPSIIAAGVVLHDWDEEDEELADYLRAKARGWRQAS